MGLLEDSSFSANTVFEGSHIDADVRATMLTARISQYYVNTSRKALEVVYTFPLAWGAVILDLEVVFGDKRLKGIIQPKKKAAQKYEEALGDGNSAVLVECQSDGSYTLNLGNLAPSERFSIHIEYAQLLQYNSDGLRLTLPTMLAQRYGDPASQGLQPHQVVQHDAMASHKLGATIRLHGHLCRASVDSPSHRIRFTTDEESARIDVLDGQWMDRDLVVNLLGIPQEPLITVAQDSISGDHVYLASTCPALPLSAPLDTRVKILVDCSGSMQGDSIQAARAALVSFIDTLQPSDRFSLSRFGNETEHRCRSLWKGTEASKRSAMRWALSLQADMGGTEMTSALLGTFQLTSDSEATDVLLITDGEVYDIDQLVAAAKNNNHRIFVVGIGNSPHQPVLRRLAAASGGEVEIVSPGEAVKGAIARMFERLRSPRVSDLRWELSDAALQSQVQWIIPAPLQAFSGDTVHLQVAFQAAVSVQVHLVGVLQSSGETVRLASADLSGAVPSPQDLVRLLQAQRIHLGALDEDTIESVANDYQLMSTKTSFVLVHEREENQKFDEMPSLHTVRHMPPPSVLAASAPVAFRRSDPLDSGVRFSRKDTSIAQIIGAPAVWRGRTSVSARIDALSSTSVDDYEIPAFLRKSNDEEVIVPVNQPGYQGLTPGDLQKTLSKLSPAQLPRSLEGLRKLGLGEAIIDWLENLRTTKLPETTELGLVLEFVQLMRDWKWNHSDPRTVSTLLGSLRSLVRGPEPVASPTRLLLESELHDIDRDSWPADVLQVLYTT